LLRSRENLGKLKIFSKKPPLKIPVAGIMRGYIFTSRELDIIQEFLQTGKRTAALNKLLHYIRHNERLLDDMRIYLMLLGLAQTKMASEKPTLPPGRPSKLTNALKGLK
jgi:hypothetical protein